jgi:hypothetical protein
VSKSKRITKDTTEDKSEGGKGMKKQDSKNKSGDEIRSGGLGRNPLDGINSAGLQGLISGDKKKANVEQDLLFTKAVKLTLDDVEFVKDMAIAVKSEGNFSEGIRACIRAARKYYGEDVKELANKRKSLEAINI